MNLARFLALSAFLRGGNSGTGGTGGSAAQSDWNAAEGEPGHVLNRTHYKENKTHYFEENKTHYAGNLGMGGILGFAVNGTNLFFFDKMKREKPCTITFDGVTTEHSPVQADLTDTLGMTGTFWGNLGLLSALGIPGENTGEPYVFFLENSGTGIFITTDTELTEHIVSMSQEIEVVRGLDLEYFNVPHIDLTELGISALTMGTAEKVSEVDTDTSAILEKLKYGFACFDAYFRYSAEGELNPVRFFATGSYRPTLNNGEWCFVSQIEPGIVFSVTIRPGYIRASIDAFSFAG